MGNAVARRALAGSTDDDEGPLCPDSLRYLLSWVQQLHARSGVGMNGFAPLTWGTLGEWSRMAGNAPDQEDIDALFLLDGVMLFPGDQAKESK